MSSSVGVVVQVLGTITQASPLRVVVDGAVTDSLADSLNAATYLLGARVTVQIRNPRIPLVIGSWMGVYRG